MKSIWWTGERRLFHGDVICAKNTFLHVEVPNGKRRRRAASWSNFTSTQFAATGQTLTKSASSHDLDFDNHTSIHATPSSPRTIPIAPDLPILLSTSYRDYAHSSSSSAPACKTLATENALTTLATPSFGWPTIGEDEDARSILSVSTPTRRRPLFSGASLCTPPHAHAHAHAHARFSFCMPMELCGEEPDASTSAGSSTCRGADSTCTGTYMSDIDDVLSRTSSVGNVVAMDVQTLLMRYHNQNEPAVFIEQKATTVMIRNIARRISLHVILAQLDARGFRHTYDFAYLPLRVPQGSNLGFAFINFVTPEYAQIFREAEIRDMRGRKSKKLSLVPALAQGKELNVNNIIRGMQQERTLRLAMDTYAYGRRRCTRTSSSAEECIAFVDGQLCRLTPDSTYP